MWRRNFSSVSRKGKVKDELWCERNKWGENEKLFYFFAIFKFFSPLLRTKRKRTNTHNTVSDGWLLIVNFCGPYATKVLDWMLSRENSSLIFQKISSLFALLENFLTLLLSFSRCSVKGCFGWSKARWLTSVVLSFLLMLLHVGEIFLLRENFLKMSLWFLDMRGCWI